MARPAWPTITNDDATGLTGTSLNLALFTAMKTYINKNLQLTNLTELTITAGGAITITEAFHTVDTAGDIGSDDLDTISGGNVGDVLVIRPADAARTIVVKHNTGNIWLKDKSDLSLDDIQDALMLIYDGTKWMDLGSISGLQNVIEDTSPQLGGDLDAQTKRVYDVKWFDFKTSTELTIAAGAITVTQSFHTVDTQGDATTDDLDTISGAVTGRLVILKAENDARTVVIKHNTGNIWLKGKVDLKLDDLADGLLLVYSGAKWIDLGAGGAGRYKEFNFPAGSWNYPTSNPAPLDRDVGTNGGMFRHLFDDTTEEFILLEPAFELPDNLDTAGTVYFSLFGYAKIADGNEVQFRLSHSSKDEGESWDAAYGTKDSGDKATDAQQDEIDQIEWNETVSNLGWAAQDLVRLMVSRIAIADGTKVTGDYGVLNLKLRLPVT